MKTRYLTLAALAVVASLGFGACSHEHDHDHEHGDMHHDRMAMPMEHIHEAVAVVYPTKGNTVSGAIYFTMVDEGEIHVHGQVTGLEPNSVHAIHIHEFGDQTSADGMSAGGHFNPEHHQHGGPMSAEHHAGDLGNLQADASGTATMDLTVKGIALNGPKDNILGRGLVIHAKADDLVSQPVGNAGGRIGVGVIGVAKHAAPATMK